MDNNIDISNESSNTYIHFYNINKESDLYVVQLGHHNTPNNYGFGPIVRDHFLIHFIKSGTGILILHNKKYILSAGQCFLITPKDIAYYKSDDDNPMKYYWIGFNGFQAHDFVLQMGFTTNNPVLPITFAKEIFYEFDRMDVIGYHKNNFLAYLGLLYYTIYYLITGCTTFAETPFTSLPKTKFTNEEYVEKIINIIQGSYNNEIFISDIATKLSLNRSYLTKIFKQQTGMPIKQYIINYRLNKASALLRNPNNSIAKVASAVGFSDPLYFSRMFHHKYNVSPTEYRKSY